MKPTDSNMDPNTVIETIAPSCELMHCMDGAIPTNLYKALQQVPNADLHRRLARYYAIASQIMAKMPPEQLPPPIQEWCAHVVREVWREA